MEKITEKDFNVGDAVIIFFDDSHEKVGYITEVLAHECKVSKEENGWSSSFHKSRLAKASQVDIHRIKRIEEHEENKRLKGCISFLERENEGKNKEIIRLKESILNMATRNP